MYVVEYVVNSETIINYVMRDFSVLITGVPLCLLPCLGDLCSDDRFELFLLILSVTRPLFERLSLSVLSLCITFSCGVTPA